MPPTYTWHFRASFRKMDEGGKIILMQNLGEEGAKGVRETVHPVGGSGGMPHSQKKIMEF